jgi:hypothetical protein
MENNPTTIESLFEKIKSFVSNSLELAKLKAIDRLADIFSSLLSNLIILLFVTLFFFMFNIGIALWIGTLLEKTYYGFLIVSSFYAAIGLILLLFKNSLLKLPIQNAIISKSLK